MLRVRAGWAEKFLVCTPTCDSLVYISRKWNQTKLICLGKEGSWEAVPRAPPSYMPARVT